MSEAFIKYTALLCMLHHEMKIERDGNEAPADQIREQMDEPWYAMSEEEQELTSKISEMVYVLDEKNVLLP